MTLIVLLILAGVSISAVVGNQGIFKKAEQATDVYNRGKAREKLELTLTDAQVIKYTGGLTDEQLTNKINEIGEEIEERETPDISQAIVDGYIFSVDRTVPKILDYLGPADGIIITASVNGNNRWFKQGETVNINVTGKIKTYSGGTITTYNATKDGNPISDFSINSNGEYTINNITSDTEIVIDATDSNGKSASKTIQVKVKIDKTAPTIIDANVITEGIKIKISAIGHDKNPQGQEESGIKQFSYSITPITGISAEQVTGVFNIGETAEISVSPNYSVEGINYSVLIGAVDNCGNEVASENKLSKSINFSILESAGGLFGEGGTTGFLSGGIISDGQGYWYGTPISDLEFWWEYRKPVAISSLSFWCSQGVSYQQQGSDIEYTAVLQGSDDGKEWINLNVPGKITLRPIGLGEDSREFTFAPNNFREWKFYKLKFLSGGVGGSGWVRGTQNFTITNATVLH